ncbi:MAG: PAS domain S-box protein [Woeseiaceae bacterium]|nr:PAS domain S-box protein [Woeseiaceae bacterium]
MPASLLPDEVVSELVHASADAAVVSDGEGRIVFVNRGAEQLFGYEALELLGRPVEVLIPSDQRDRHEGLRQAFSHKPRRRPMLSGMELHGCRKDGSHFRAEIALTPVKTSEGVLVASTVREIDVDNQSEAYFRTLLEAAPDAMIIVDQKGKMTVVNGQAETMFGYDRDQMLGRSIEMLLPDRLRSLHKSHRKGFVGTPELRAMGDGQELIGLRRDGTEFPVEISLSPVSTSSGMFVSSVIRDVTARKEMENEIIEARREAERANNANSAFLAAASHDLRQPVQALSLLNGALRRTVKDERALEMIDSQQHSLTAMTNLLNSLLDISRLDAGAVSPEFEDFPMQRLIDRLSAEFGRQAQHKGLDFGAEGCGAIVRSDPNLLAEIIQNFVSNAIRYTDKGRVEISCSEVEGYCSLKVTDTGIGIEADQLRDIFREFHQCKSRGATKEGFGLGLAIVSRLADLLDHKISVSSQPGEGSEFSVMIPVVEAGVEVADEAEDFHSNTSNGGAQGLVVLIEDDVNVADAWGLLLEAEGYRVATAASAKEAKALMYHIADPPALLISDFHLLDGSTGVEAVAAIREHFDEEIPAFVVSGDTSKVVKDARLLDNCTLMSKPIDTGRLLTAADTAVRTGLVPAD